MNSDNRALETNRSGLNSSPASNARSLLLAGAYPAHRASGIEPIAALRAEG